MEGNSSEDYGNGGISSPREGISDGQRCQSVDSLSEWCSSEQVENGTPSTSPPFWDTEDDSDDCDACEHAASHLAAFRPASFRWRSRPIQ